MEELCLLGLLGICSVEDLKYHRLQIVILWAFGILGIILHMCRQTFSLTILLGGMAVGGCMIFISLLSRGNIGMGDGILISVCGIYLGLWNNIWLLLLTMGMMSVTALGLLVTKKRSRTDELAFVPFLFLAYLLYLGMKEGFMG